MSISVKYKCKENDNQIRFEQDGGDDPGEFWFADELGKHWIVIGKQDLFSFFSELHVIPKAPANKRRKK